MSDDRKFTQKTHWRLAGSVVRVLRHEELYMAGCLALALTLKRNKCRVVHVMSRYPLIAIDLMR